MVIGCLAWASVAPVAAQQQAPVREPMPADPARGPALRIDTVVEPLDHPWSIAFLPDGRQLVTERPGRLRLIDGGVPSAPIEGVPPVMAESQGGLFDVLLHPDFARTGELFLSYAHGTPDRNAVRVLRARLDGTALVDQRVIFTASPWKDTPVHFGGRLALLPDDTLLLTIGDGFDYREAAQRLDSHLGKVVRLTFDGGAPSDNPFLDVEGARPELYSIGHRNAQGLAVDAATGTVWSHEHGPAGGDEINRIVPGGNYGWPVATGGRDYSGAAISPFRRRDGMIDPRFEWTPSIAPGGFAIGAGALFPDLRGTLLVAALKSRELLSVRLADEPVRQAASSPSRTGEPQARSARLLADQGRLRDVRVAPDGALWVLVDAERGRALRLVPGGGVGRRVRGGAARNQARFHQSVAGAFVRGTYTSPPGRPLPRVLTPMRLRTTLSVAALAALATLPLAGTVRAVEPGAPWPEVLEEARGQTVWFNAWGGSDRINEYLEWVGEQVQREHGVTLEHVKVGDIAEIVSQLAAARAAGQDEGGRVDLMWVNGENFAALKQGDMIWGNFADALPNAALVRESPSITFDFSIPVEGLESPWGGAQLVFIHDSATLSEPPRSAEQLLAFVEDDGRFAYPAPPAFHGTTFLKQLLGELVDERHAEALTMPADQADIEAGHRPPVAVPGRTAPEPARRGPHLARQRRGHAPAAR